MNFYTCALVFVVTALVDALYVAYTGAILAKKPSRAATIGSTIHLANAFAVIQYTGDWRYIIVVAAGSWVGTWCTLHWQCR